ncbi:MAG: class I SAM-dependent methyltransferase [Candidatus Omnitrophica bacterium]|nr:class I SAM-dependent methyltransferase [Candidatus Omnitrophota bacterium]
MATNDLIDTLYSIDSSTNYNRWLYKSIEQDLRCAKQVLDVGSGIGSIGQYLGEDGVKQVILSDHCEKMLDLLKLRFNHLSNYRIAKLDISEQHMCRSVPIESIDAITCINVLEHIKADAEALQNMRRLLSPGGRLLLIVPALSWLYGTLDKLGEHYRRYDREELNEKLNKSGFVVEKQRCINFFGIFTWYLAGKILKQNNFNKGANRLLDKFIPFLEFIERYWRFPIGQSIVTCCKKAGF